MNLKQETCRRTFSRWFSVVAFIAFAAVTLHLGSVNAHAAQATLSWKAPTTYTDGTPLTSLKGYKIHTGTASGSYTRSLDVGNVTSYVLSGLTDATTYYFAVSAYDTSGRVSGYSNEAKFLTATTPTATLYTLTAAPTTGGSITPAGSVIVSAGTSQTYAIAPATGYKIADVKVDGTSVGAVSSYTLSNVSANHTIAASFVSSGTSGTGTLASSTTWKSQAITAQKGSFSAVFDAIPAAGNINAITGFSALQPGGYADVAAIVRFNTSGTIDARNGGSYAARTSIPYSAGKSYRIRMQIDVPNHRYDAWVTPAGGAEIQLASGYAFRTEQATVSALNYLGLFAATGSHQVQNLAVTSAPPVASYTLSASATTGGTVAPAGTTTVTAGAGKTYTITPATGYRISDVRVDGTSVGAVSSYTFSNVTANHTISASFAATASYTISARAYANGSISPSGTSTVLSGGSKSYTITPAPGYTVSAVAVDGVSVGRVTSYTFSNVKANHTIAVSFAATASYTISATAYANGSISPSGTSTVTSGGSKSYTIKPASGYTVSAVKVDGVSIGRVTSYTFSNVKANHTIAVSFKLI